MSKVDFDAGGWCIDPEKAEVCFPNTTTTGVKKKVYHKYKDLYYSTPYHKEWDSLPRELLFRVWVPNGDLAIENLSLFFQALMGPSGLETDAATEFLGYLTWPHNPENEDLAAIAVAMDHILASNGNSAGTLTVARTATGFDFDKTTRYPIYVRFQKEQAKTDVDVPRFPDQPRTEARTPGIDHGLLRCARKIQEAAANPPVEAEIGLQSYGGLGGGELSVGLDIRNETTINEEFIDE